MYYYEALHKNITIISHYVRYSTSQLQSSSYVRYSTPAPLLSNERIEQFHYKWYNELMTN